MIPKEELVPGKRLFVVVQAGVDSIKLVECEYRREREWYGTPTCEVVELDGDRLQYNMLESGLYRTKEEAVDSIVHKLYDKIHANMRQITEILEQL